MNDLKKVWAHRWVSPKAAELDSAIDRKGLIAIEDIRAGEVVLVYGGVIIPKSGLKNYRDKVGDYDLPLNEEFSIAPVSRDEAISIGSVNHSCEPTVGWQNSVMLVTLRDVKAGEELAPDYAMHGGYEETMVCNCGAKTCRKLIRPDDWMNPEIQAKYGKWFLPFLKSKIKS